MKKRLRGFLCCLAAVGCLTACGEKEKKTETETQITETESQTTEKETTEKETTEKETEKKTEQETMGKTETEAVQAKTQAPSVPAPQPQTEAVYAPETDAPYVPETEAAYVPETQDTSAWEEFTVEPSPRVYEEEYLQCPYCGEWLSTLPDGGLWNPYDRHVLSERDAYEGGYLTEQEMAQCPDCLNWYETGNIFRNHICTGRETPY